MKGNILRNVINNMLLVIIFINAGVGTAMLFGTKKGLAVHSMVLITLCLNIKIQEKKAKKEAKRVSENVLVMTKLMQNNIYAKIKNDEACKVLTVTENKTTDETYVVYKNLNENVTVLEKLETFLDSTYIVLDLEERMKQEGK